MKWQWAVIALCVTCSVASAEDRKFCLIGRDSCEYIGLVELHIEKQHRFNIDDDALTVDFGVGVMTRSGFGVTFGGRTYDFSPDTHVMLRGRYRYWAASMLGLDASVAPMLAAKLRPGINFQLAAEYADQVGIVVDFDVVHVSNFDTMNGSDTAITAGLGLRFTNFAAVPAAIIGIIAAVSAGGD